MIYSIKRLLITVLFALVLVQAEAQSIMIDAIEFRTTSFTGESNLPSYQTFISNTRNPSLFRTQNPVVVSDNFSASRTGFAIDFLFRSTSVDHHQFIGGFETSTFTSDLYEVSGSFRDTLDVSGKYEAKNEYFFLKAGYNYIRSPQKKFTVTAGAVFNVGIPVSAKAMEIIQESSLDETSFSFFAKQSVSFGLSVPIGIRFKVINNFSLTLKTQPTFQYNRIDGTPLLTVFRGTNLGFHFKIREKG